MRRREFETVLAKNVTPLRRARLVKEETGTKVELLMNMKIIIIGLVAVFSFKMSAEDAVVAPGASVAPNTHFSMELKTYNFFLPLHPLNDRDPKWPKKLNFEPVTSMSVAEFSKLLKGKHWRIMYTCEGAPVTADPSIYDGIHMGFLDYDYDDVNQHSSHTKPKSSVALKQSIAKDEENGILSIYIVEEDETEKYSIDSYGSGRFGIVREKFKQYPSPVQVARVKETNDLILVEPPGDMMYCNGKIPLRAIRVPVDPVGY
jgi:hypothetical protein